MNKRIFRILLVFFLAFSTISVTAAVTKGGSSVSFAASSYTIKYVLNGGTNNKSNPSKYKSSKAVTLKSPTKKGYTFVGWYTDKAFKKPITKINKGSTGKKTVYARWTRNKYSIVFKGNNATSGSMKKITNVKYGKSVTLTANAFKKEGCTFNGWNTKADGSGTAYANKASVKNLTAKNNGKVTLYAQWVYKFKPDSYNVKPNDGKDDTEGINQAIEDASERATASGGRAVVNLASGIYDVTINENETCAIKMRSNVELKMKSGTTIRVKKKSVSTDCSVIGFFGAYEGPIVNATVSGGKLIGTGKISSSGDIYGIWTKYSKNITISGMEIKNNECDGIYLSPQQMYGGGTQGNYGINILNCKIHDNCRTNVSIVDADKVTIKNCKIYSPGDESPSACINIEPNRHNGSGDKKCKDILIENCTLDTGHSGDNWDYLAFQAYDNTQGRHTVAENVRFNHCTIKGVFNNYDGKNVVVKDTTIEGTKYGID
jgi:uncharacterized repeat protein (TIGR02543 family)